MHSKKIILNTDSKNPCFQLEHGRGEGKGYVVYQHSWKENIDSADRFQKCMIGP